MAYSYSDWANEFASVEEKKEKPGLGTRNEPLESNTPTFIEQVVKNYNDNTDDPDPEIVKVPVKPSTITDNSRENKYVEEQKYSQNLKTKLLDKLIKTNSTPHTQMDLLKLSASGSGSNDVIIIDGKTVVTMSKKSTPRFEAFLNGSNAYKNDLITLDISKKESDDTLFRRWDYVQDAINSGKYGDDLIPDPYMGTGETTKLSDPYLFQQDFQSIFDQLDGGGSTNETNAQRLRRIEADAKADGISLSDIVKEAVTMWKDRREDPLGPPKGPDSKVVKAFGGVVATVTKPIDSMEDLFSKVTEKYPGLSFSIASKPTGNRFLNLIDQDEIVDVSGTRMTYTKDTPVGKVSASSFMDRLIDEKEYMLMFTSLGGNTVTLNEGELDYKVRRFPIFSGGGLNISADMSRNAGIGVKVDYSKKDIAGTGVRFDSTTGLNERGKTWDANLTYKKAVDLMTEEKFNMGGDTLTGSYGLKANLKNQTLTADANLSFNSGPFSDATAEGGLGVRWVSGKGPGASLYYTKDLKPGDSILNPFNYFKR
jgi:hypothetical protein